MEHINKILFLFAEGNYHEVTQEYSLFLSKKESIKLPLNERFSLYSAVGVSFKEIGNHIESLKLHKQSLSIAKELAEENKIALCYTNIGSCYKSKGENTKAIELFKKALEIEKRNCRDNRVSINLNNIATVYESWGKYNKAIDIYEEALSLLSSSGDRAKIRNNIGEVYRALGKYDQALKNYEKALYIFEENDYKYEIPSLKNNIGLIYFSWGAFDKALDYFEEALEQNIQLKRKDSVALCLRNIGVICKFQKNYDKAIQNYENALIIDRELNNQIAIAINLNNIGSAYECKNEYDKSVSYYEECAKILKNENQIADLATTYNNIAAIFYRKDEYSKSITYYKKALKISKKINYKDRTALYLHNMAVSYYELEKYNIAASLFQKSIDIKEVLRKTADMNMRMEYLDSQISTYQFLTSCQIRSENYYKAYESIELSRTRVLNEILSRNDDVNHCDVINHIQKSIPEDTAIVVYGNVLPDWENMCVIIVTKEKIIGKEINIIDFVEFVFNNYEKMLIIIENTDVDGLEKIIKFYHSILSDPYGLYSNELKIFGKLLYDFLVFPIYKHIENKENLIFNQGTLFSLIPFETLIDKNNEYLINQFSISYIQSIYTLFLVNSRKFKKDRSSALLIGNASYQKSPNKEDSKDSNNRLNIKLLREEMNHLMKKSLPLDGLYSKLGYSQWANLSFSKEEIYKIKKYNDFSDVLENQDVTLSNIMEISNQGGLLKYKIIHFAVHGVFIPELPELSGLVLSDANDNINGNYLTINRIKNLKINADFINLSACESGLGKNYKGEGVVGLTQAFIIAGANSISATLWLISDQSTKYFMVEVYKLIKERDIGYGKAIAEVKRKFINGYQDGKYKHPYYWSPYIYYGQ